MATKNITIHVNHKEVEVTIGSAMKADGIRRSELMLKASTDMKSDVDLTGQVAFYLYPTCVSCVYSPESVKNMSLEEFLTVDEQDMDKWCADGYEMNPQWRTTFSALSKIGEDNALKKTGTSLSGLDELTAEEMERRLETSLMSQS